MKKEIIIIIHITKILFIQQPQPYPDVFYACALSLCLYLIFFLASCSSFYKSKKVIRSDYFFMGVKDTLP